MVIKRKNKIIEPISILTLGSDPEVFLMDESSLEIISAENLIHGTKDSPRILEEGFGIQEDCVLAEITIPPSKTKADFTNNIKKCLELIKKELPEGLTIKCSASEILDNRFLVSEQARTGGCSPDYNAYTTKVNPKPKMSSESFRTSGFHIHLGFNRIPDYEETCQMIRYLDLYLGVPSIIIDKDKRRRKLYGKAGCFRHKESYGFEYRVLSGFFSSNEYLTDWIWEQCQLAIDAYLNQTLTTKDFVTINKIINSGDEDGANKLINTFNLKLPKYEFATTN